MVSMNFKQCWKAKLERPHFFKVQSGKITVFPQNYVTEYFSFEIMYNFLKKFRFVVFEEVWISCQSN